MLLILRNICNYVGCPFFILSICIAVMPFFFLCIFEEISQVCPTHFSSRFLQHLYCHLLLPIEILTFCYILVLIFSHFTQLFLNSFRLVPTSGFLLLCCSAPYITVKMPRGFQRLISVLIVCRVFETLESFGSTFSCFFPPFWGVYLFQDWISTLCWHHDKCLKYTG